MTGQEGVERLTTGSVFIHDAPHTHILGAFPASKAREGAGRAENGFLSGVWACWRVAADGHTGPPGRLNAKIPDRSSVRDFRWLTRDNK